MNICVYWYTLLYTLLFNYLPKCEKLQLRKVKKVTQSQLSKSYFKGLNQLCLSPTRFPLHACLNPGTRVNWS